MDGTCGLEMKLSQTLSFFLVSPDLKGQNQSHVQK